ncbi:MAG: hypothetical protein JNJ77_13545 [Planctomycetia bacterium]|nr:hypothetical protein [Planctomycetia bacterium]
MCAIVGETFQPNASYFIGDTNEGKVFLSRTTPDVPESEPRQLLLIFGKDHVTPPSMLMTRMDFRKWREKLQDEGCRVELKFAS